MPQFRQSLTSNTTRTALAALALGLYALLLIYWMLWGFGRERQAEYSYNLVPFLTIYEFVQMDASLWKAQIINLIGNIVVFVPFGLFFPVLLKWRFWRQGALFLGMIAVLETVQLLTRRGTFDVDDFMLNSVGFVLGFQLYAAISGLLTSRGSGGRNAL